jgi:hypothetical protein
MSAGLRSATPIELKDTDPIVRGSNAEIEQETIEIARSRMCTPIEHTLASGPKQRGRRCPLAASIATDR